MSFFFFLRKIKVQASWANMKPFFKKMTKQYKGCCNCKAVEFLILTYKVPHCHSLGRSRAVGELLAPVSPFDKKCGRENWTVAFAPDGSYFAWSQGHRIVKLVPWSQCLNNL